MAETTYAFSTLRIAVSLDGAVSLGNHESQSPGPKFPSPEVKADTVMDVFSTVAAIISVADVASRLCAEVFAFVTALKHASAELRRLNSKTAELGGILSHVKSLITSYQGSMLFERNQSIFKTVDVILKASTDDLQSLLEILGKPIATNDAVLNRFGKRIRSVFNEKAIAKISLRLEGYQASLSNALIIIGR